MEQKTVMIEELKLVSTAIERMGRNSFYIKGWSVTSILATILIAKTNIFVYYLLFIPIALFAFLDCYYLYIERLYRELYRWIIDNRLSTNDHLFSMDYKRFRTNVSFFKTLKSNTISFFYGALVALNIAIIILILNGGYLL